MSKNIAFELSSSQAMSSMEDDSKAAASCWRVAGCPSEKNNTDVSSSNKNSGQPACNNNMASPPRPHYYNHHQPISKNGLEEILVQGMNHLSFDELQREQEDLHGVADHDFVEEETVIEELLQSLEKHLNRMKSSSSGTTAYQLAEARDPTYVHSRDFRMVFLRGNRYDPKKSAEQMIQYFALKHELFGDEKLCRDITIQDDLSQEDIANLLEGSAQIGSCPDRSGRAILLEFPGQRSASTNVRNELRARFYCAMKVCFSLEDPSRGAVLISYCVGQYRERLNGRGFMESMRLALAMPGNIAGLHLCVDDLRDAMIAKACFALLPARLRAKTKLHFGSHQECQYLLSGYGIPREALPFTDPNSEMDLTYHNYWFQQCLQKEQGGRTDRHRVVPAILEKDGSACTTPEDNDVLCIGRRVQGRAGNDLLFSMAQFHAVSYHKGNLTDRRVIVEDIMAQVRQRGGRFLKMDK